MKTKQYGFSDAIVKIIGEKSKIAIFDVSPTIECRWIAVSNQDWSLLTVFAGTREMLKFVAYEQIHGATVPNEDGWLDDQAGMDGFDTWTEFVESERTEMELR